MKRRVNALLGALMLALVAVVPAGAVTMLPSLYQLRGDGTPDAPMNVGDAVCVGRTWTSKPLGLMAVPEYPGGPPLLDVQPGETVSVTVVDAWADPGLGVISVLKAGATETFVVPDPWPPEGGLERMPFGYVLTPTFFRLQLKAAATEASGFFGAVVAYTGDLGSRGEIRVQGVGGNINVETPTTAQRWGHPEICPANSDTGTGGANPTVTAPPTATLAIPNATTTGDRPAVPFLAVVGFAWIAGWLVAVRRRS